MILILKNNYKHNYFVTYDEVVMFLKEWYNDVFNATIIHVGINEMESNILLRYYYNNDLSKTVHHTNEYLDVYNPYDCEISPKICKIIYASENNL